MSKILDFWQGMTATVLPFAGPAAPNGWLLCHGQAVSRATYAALFSVVGSTYGAGDGSTTFNLPDLRGEFVRGLDGGSGRDTGRTLGSKQADATKEHIHTTNASLPALHINAGGTTLLATGGGAALATTGFGATGGMGGTTETRPRNIALNHIIKF